MNVNEPLKKHRESETFCRKWKHDKVQFKFLGFDFQPRRAKSKRDGKMYLGYFPVISNESRQRIILVLRKTNLHRASESTIEEIAKALNPKLRGWINYYGKFGKHALNRVMRKLDDRLGEATQPTKSSRFVASHFICPTAQTPFFVVKLIHTFKICESCNLFPKLYNPFQNNNVHPCGMNF